MEYTVFSKVEFFEARTYYMNFSFFSNISNFSKFFISGGWAGCFSHSCRMDRELTCVQPSVHHHICCGLGIVDVAFHDLRTTDYDFAVLVTTQNIPRVHVDDLRGERTQ